MSESLAGRLALCELTPFLVSELPRRKADDLWLRGGYPDGGILDGRAFPAWQRNYLALRAQRDLPAWGLPARPSMTERLFRMLAASHGGLWHASPIGASLGLSYHTVNSYLEHIQGAFLVRLLGHLSSHGRDHEACFFRTSDGYEIDLVLEFGRARWAIEIKLTTAPSPADLDRLVRTADLIGATRCCLVSRTSRPARSPAVLSADPLGLLAVLDEA